MNDDPKDSKYNAQDDDRAALTSDELMSVLLDGEISESDLTALLRDFESDKASISKWQRINVASATLNDARVEIERVDLNFVKEVRAKINEEQDLMRPSTQEYKNVRSLSEHRDKSKLDNIDDGSSRGMRTFGQRIEAFSKMAVAASVMFVAVFVWFFSVGEQNSLMVAVNEAFNSNADTKLEAVYPSDTSAVAYSEPLYTQSGEYRVLVNAGSSAPNAQEGTRAQHYLSKDRMQRYMLMHAENASLNINQGMLPFARVSHIENEKPF